MHQESRLIPRKTLFGNPERTDVRISRDGARISYLAPVEGVLNIWVAKADAIGDARPITRDIHRGIRVYFWTYRPDHIMYLQDRDGDENWHVYVVDVETAETRDLTPYDGVQALPLLPSEFFPDEVLIGINRRDPRVPDLYRVNILTGETELVVSNDFGAVRFVSDAKLTPRLAVVPTPRGGAHVLSPSESGRWEIAMDIEPEDEQTTHLINFDVQGSTLYMFDSRGRDTSALVAVDTETGSVRELAADPRADAAGVMVNPVTGRPQAAAFAYDRIAWQILDDSIAADFRRLASAERGEFYVSSRTMDDLAWIVEYERDDGPKAYYLYTRETGEAEYLFSDRPDLEPADLARMRTATVKSRDGLDMVVYYTMPPGSTDTAPDPPGDPLPAVLYVHGGPWARDIWGYNPVHQFLANRGYVVISPNFRGSTGFGETVRERRRPRVGRCDARRPAGCSRMGGRAGDHRPREGGDHGRKLRRLRGAGWPDLYPGRVRMRGGYRGTVQPEYTAGFRSALLGADDCALPDPSRRQHHPGRQAPSGREIATDKG